MAASPLVRLQKTVIEQFEQRALKVEGDDKMSHADQNSREVAIDLYKNSGDTLSCALEKAKKIFEEIVDITSLEVLLWESGVKSTLQELRHIERGIYGELEKVEEVAPRIAAHVQLHDSDMVSSGPFLSEVRVLSQDFLSSEILEVAKGKLEELMLGYQPICTAKERGARLANYQREYKEYVADERKALADRYWYLCDSKLFSKGKAEKLRKSVHALYEAAVLQKEKQVVDERVSMRLLNPQMYARLEEKVEQFAESLEACFSEDLPVDQQPSDLEAYAQSGIMLQLTDLIRSEYTEVVGSHLSNGPDLSELRDRGLARFTAIVAADRAHFIGSKRHKTAVSLKLEGLAEAGFSEKDQKNLEAYILEVDNAFITDMSCFNYCAVSAKVFKKIKLIMTLRFASIYSRQIATQKTEECYDSFCKSLENKMMEGVQQERSAIEYKGTEYGKVRVILGMLSGVQKSEVLEGPVTGPLFEEHEMAALRDSIDAMSVAEKPPEEVLLAFVHKSYFLAIQKKYDMIPPMSWSIPFGMRAVAGFCEASGWIKKHALRLSQVLVDEYNKERILSAAEKGSDVSMACWYQKYHQALSDIKNVLPKGSDPLLNWVFTPRFIQKAALEFRARLESIQEGATAS